MGMYKQVVRMVIGAALAISSAHAAAFVMVPSPPDVCELPMRATENLVAKVSGVSARSFRTEVTSAQMERDSKVLKTVVSTSGGGFRCTLEWLSDQSACATVLNELKCNRS